MTTLLLTLALNCPMTRIVDSTPKRTWGKSEDVAALHTAKDRCKEIYGDVGPCLKTFEKTDEYTYKATCGLE